MRTVNHCKAALAPPAPQRRAAEHIRSCQSLHSRPLCAGPPSRAVAELPGTTALCAITDIGYDKYAVIGGVRGNYNYTNETIYIVDYSSGAAEPEVSIAANTTTVIMLNGIDHLPAYPEVVLAGDARQCSIFRIDTNNGSGEVGVDDEQLAPLADVATLLGIKGLKIHNVYVYYTNTIRNTFGAPRLRQGQ